MIRVKNNNIKSRLCLRTKLNVLEINVVASRSAGGEYIECIRIMVTYPMKNEFVGTEFYTGPPPAAMD